MVFLTHERPKEFGHIEIGQADFYLLCDRDGILYAVAALEQSDIYAPAMLGLHLIVTDTRKAYKNFQEDIDWMRTYAKMSGYRYVYGIPKPDIKGREMELFCKFASRFGFTETAKLGRMDAVVLPVQGG